MSASVPLSLYAGDTALWVASPALFPADQGWALVYTLSGPQKITINAAPDGSSHRVEVGATTTAAWAAGEYAWIARATKDGQVFTVETGRIEIKADPTAVAATDARPHCKKVLDAIEAVIEDRATHDELVTEVKGRRLERVPMHELIQLRREYLAEWRRYLARAAGRKTQTIKVGFKCR